MAFTQRMTDMVLQGGLTTAYPNDFVGSNRQSLDESIADGVTDLAVAVAIDVSALKAIIIASDKDTTFETNGTKATEILTLTGQPLDTETVTLDTKVYTFQTSLTDTDGNVLIGATASDSLDNLIAAIGLGAGSGTTYAASTTKHTSVTALAGAGDTMDVTAIQVGTAGNSLATTETLTNGSFSDTTMSGGVATDNTINLLAGVPYVWTNKSYFVNLLTVDIVSVHLTNASGSTTKLLLEAVQDATP